MKRFPIKFNSEFVDELDRHAFYAGRLVPNWPRRVIGRGERSPKSLKSPNKLTKSPTNSLKSLKSPNKSPKSLKSPTKSPNDSKNHASTRLPSPASVPARLSLKIGVNFNLLFGILHEMVSDADNTATRRAILQNKMPALCSIKLVTERLVSFIKKFTRDNSSILGPVNEYFTCDDIEAPTDKKYDIVIIAHKESGKYMRNVGKYLICYYFDADPELFATYNKLYMAISGETASAINMPREKLRGELQGLKFLAETDETANINNTLNAYAMCYTI